MHVLMSPVTLHNLSTGRTSKDRFLEFTVEMSAPDPDLLDGVAQLPPGMDPETFGTFFKTMGGFDGLPRC